MDLLAVGFYDQVMRELLAAIGGALFLGNLLALIRRRRDRQRQELRARRKRRDPDDLERAPVGRTVLYLVLGFVVMIWGIGSLVVAS